VLEDPVQLSDERIEALFIYRKSRELSNMAHVILRNGHQP
jgi:hypothetical protein